MDNARCAKTLPPVATTCRIKRITALSTRTFQVDLCAPEGTVLDYQGGHYLQLELALKCNGPSQTFSYSIANSVHPDHPHLLQIFIENRSVTADNILQRLSERHQKNEGVNVTLPMGQAYLQTNLNLPHLLIAAGSGISKIKCIAESIMAKNPSADMNIYWSNRDQSDFYLLQEFESWATRYKHLRFTPILESSEKSWLGRSGYIYEVIETDFETLGGAQIYLCGSPQMVYGTIDKLEYKGLSESDCYSDVFEYAPRGQQRAVCS